MEFSEGRNILFNSLTSNVQFDIYPGTGGIRSGITATIMPRLNTILISPRAFQSVELPPRFDVTDVACSLSSDMTTIATPPVVTLGAPAGSVLATGTATLTGICGGTNQTGRTLTSEIFFHAPSGGTWTVDDGTKLRSTSQPGAYSTLSGTSNNCTGTGNDVYTIGPAGAIGTAVGSKNLPLASTNTGANISPTFSRTVNWTLCSTGAPQAAGSYSVPIVAATVTQ